MIWLRYFIIQILSLLALPLFCQFAPISYSDVEYHDIECYLARDFSYRAVEYIYDVDSYKEEKPKLARVGYLIDTLGRIVEKVYWSKQRAGSVRGELTKMIIGYNGKEQVRSLVLVSPNKKIKYSKKLTKVSKFFEYLASNHWPDTIFRIKYEYLPNGLPIMQTLYYTNKIDSNLIERRFLPDSLSYTLGYTYDNKYSTTDSFKIVGDTTYHWKKMGVLVEGADRRIKFSMAFWRKKAYHKIRERYLSVKQGVATNMNMIRVYNRDGLPQTDYWDRSENFTRQYGYDEDDFLRGIVTFRNGFSTEAIFVTYDFELY